MSEGGAAPGRRLPSGDWQKLGGRIAELRRARQMSESELGRAIARSADYIASIERGQHRPRTLRLRKIAEVLRTDYSELAELAGYSPGK